MTLQQVTFYDTLDSETRIIVQQHTIEIKGLMRRAAQDIIEIGQKLIEVKGWLGHGVFGEWLQAEFVMTDRTARNYMSVAEAFKSEIVSDLIAPKALYLLSAPSTPEPARLEALDRAAAGEPITHATARDIVSNHTNPPIPFVPEEEEPLTAYEQQIAERYVQPESDTAPAGKMKPKVNRAGDTYTPQGFDACQTPPKAIDPLLPYLPMNWTIWEPACGEGNLVEAFYDASRTVIGSDILTGDNFFLCDEPAAWDCIITNPPYSIKYEWLERCYQFGRPFALLLPLETLGAARAQRLFIEHGIQLLLLNRRVNFKMPNIGWDGSAAQFPVAWFTWQFNMEDQIIFGRIDP